MQQETGLRQLVRIREIECADFPQLKLLFTGSYSSDEYSWLFNFLRHHPTPAGQPKYGYLLEARGKAVGGIILISSSISTGQGSFVRCQLTSLRVDPEFRGHGAFLLMTRAKSNPDVTYVNLSAVPASRPIIEAQGFVKYAHGQFAAIPILSAFKSSKSGVRILEGSQRPGSPFTQYEYDLMADHARYGCVCFWCATGERAYPFVFKLRFVKRVIPVAQLIYCQDAACIKNFAKQIGLVLARYGRFLILVDANGPMTGLIGRYFDGWLPRWYKGKKPRLGDLAYTLAATPWRTGRNWPD